MKDTQTPRKWKTLDSQAQNTEEILAGKSIFITLSDHYEIYDYGEITNLNNDSDAIIIFNGSLKQPLPKGTQAVLNRPFRDIQIKNNGASSIAVGQIQVFYKHTSKKTNFINTGSQILWAVSRFI